jgi:hypothetical protein
VPSGRPAIIEASRPPILVAKPHHTIAATVSTGAGNEIIGESSALPSQKRLDFVDSLVQIICTISGISALTKPIRNFTYWGKDQRRKMYEYEGGT